MTPMSAKEERGTAHPPSDVQREDRRSNGAPGGAYAPATKPTLCFVGVTTAQSSIMRVFPAWAAHLGLGDVEIRGIDFPLHAEPAAYREAVAFLRDDPRVRGALVTTHKIDLFAACRDMFDDVDAFAGTMGETSCLSKRDGRLVCHAKDPISSGLAIDGFLAQDHFARTGGAALAFGAGGSTIAITWHLMHERADRPCRIVVTDREAHRLEEIRRIHDAIGRTCPVDYVLAGAAGANDAVLGGMPPASLVINATGLGKDAPGSPITDAAAFPDRAVAWDLNYRGALLFLDRARSQEAARGLTVVNGWTYFIHGWTQVIAEVFDHPIGTDPATIRALTDVANRATGAA